MSKKFVIFDYLKIEIGKNKKGLPKLICLYDLKKEKQSDLNE